MSAERHNIERARDERNGLVREAQLLELRGGRLLVDAVRAAQKAGVPAGECAKLAGMSRQRLHQLLERYG